MNLDATAVALGASQSTTTNWLAPLSYAAQIWEINTNARLAAFLAQIGYESMGLQFLSEIWGPTADQLAYEPPSAKATELGNTQKGDGYLFRGRTPIMLTGRADYVLAAQALCYDCDTNPDMTLEPSLGANIAGWYWSTHNCNALADAGNFEAVTKAINGGLNGYQQRLTRWAAAKQALGVT